MGGRLRKPTAIGVISDTHGLVRESAREVLSGCDLIVHAGDIGAQKVIDELTAIAPVRAVRGNVDRGDWARAYPETDVVEVAGLLLYLLHDRGQLDLDPVAAGFAAVISGHSHVPAMDERGGVLYFNPGSAGPRRFRLPISIGRITVAGGRLTGELIELAA